MKWVKRNFLSGRGFADDADLAAQAEEWTTFANARPNDATKCPPMDRLGAEVTKGGLLPPTAHDYGLLESARVTPESVIHVGGNCYSVPIDYVGMTLTVRLHRDRVAILHNDTRAAVHNRSSDGDGTRSIDPAHFEPLFGKKPRAQVMLYRQELLELGGIAIHYMSELSCRRRNHLGEEVLAVHALLERHGKEALIAGMNRADAIGAYGAEHLEAFTLPAELGSPLLRLLPDDVPVQDEVDRELAQYEEFVTLAGGEAW